MTAIEVRRATATIHRVDVLRLFGAAAASLGLTSWLFFVALPLKGELGFVITAWAVFVLLFSLLTAFDENRPTIVDRIISIVVHSIAFLLLLVLAVVVVYTVGRGLEALPNLNFFTQDMSNAGPLDPLVRGGVLHAIVGTLIMITIALLISVPLGLLTAVFLSEFPGRYSRLVRTVVEAMTALPSIVHLRHGYRVFWFQPFGFCGVTRHHGDDASDHHSLGRRRASTRAWQPQGSLAGSRRLHLANGVARDPADGPLRAHHRSDFGDSAGDR
jgi:hypothetical protein